jgi:RNA polymerase sigma factor (TIGR02999 family)
MTASPGEVTRLLAELKLGRTDALARLMPLVYQELRRLAGHYLRGERSGHTLQPTALVHEVFLRLAGQDRANWQCRSQFMGVAAQLMRRILVDYARRRNRSKRAGASITLHDDLGVGGSRPIRWEEIMAVDEVLERLALLDPRTARTVEMRYFGGLSVEETAEALGVSPRTVKTEWAMARAWMHAELAGRTA